MKSKSSDTGCDQNWSSGTIDKIKDKSGNIYDNNP